MADSPLRRESQAPRAHRPLRRIPKTLTQAPQVFDVSSSAGGGALTAGRGPAAARPIPAGGTGTTFTDEPGELVPAAEDQVVDPVLRSRAREIAARLSIPRPKAEGRPQRGFGDLASVPYLGGSDDIDLDRTLEMLAERPVPEDEDIVVRERLRTRRSVVLAVDVSGSMKGERVRTAAATVGALAAELEDDALGVIAFWSDAAILLHLGDPVRPMELLDSLLRLPARGLTNISFPLHLAASQLAGVPQRNARVVLLSDCVHNAGEDPRPVAGRLPRLDVLLDMTGEKDVDLGRELARIGRGSFRTVRSHHDVAPALTEMFRS